MIYEMGNKKMKEYLKILELITNKATNQQIHMLYEQSLTSFNS